MVRRPPISTRTYTLLPSTTLFRSAHPAGPALSAILRGEDGDRQRPRVHEPRADALAAGGAHAAALSRRPRLYRRTRRVGRARAGAARFRAASDRRELPRDAVAHAPHRRSLSSPFPPVPPLPGRGVGARTGGRLPISLPA